MRELAKKRLGENLKQSIKYLTLVFNDFFILALIFLFGALMFWYAQIMKQLPSNLWFYRPLLGLILVLPLFFGRFVTLLKPADLQFLLPQDAEMFTYLKPMFWYSLVLPFILEILVWGIMFPFALVKAKLTFGNYLALAVALLFSKALDLKMQSWRLYFGKDWALIWQQLFILLFAQITLLVPGFFLVVIVINNLFNLKPPKAANFNWLKAVNLEQSRKQQVYSLFSLFTDVKEKNISIKRRQYLDFLLPKSSVRQTPNEFLYRRSLIRNPEYSNLLIRMTLFAILLSLLLQDIKWALGLSCLVIFLTAYQLLPLINEYDQNIMYQVYPIDQTKNAHALVKVLGISLLVQWLIISLSWLILIKITFLTLIAIIILLAFSLLINYLYLPLRAKRQERFRRR